MIVSERSFADGGTLAHALAGDVATALQKAIDAKGHAVLAVSGGTTPKRFFAALSNCDLPWDRITVTLVDERQVDESSERSNARMVRQCLLTNRAAAARFVPLHRNPDAGKTGPFDAAVLGMGSDGHTASFFPGGDRLAEALDPHSRERLIVIAAPGAGEPRLTFTLPALLEASLLCLHIEGAEKRKVLEEALKPGPVEAMPVRAILRAAKPVVLYWCP
jgi:6-phosphogluconolactonase